MVLIVSLLFGALIGLSLGLLGAGGSILILPILVYVVGLEPQQAVVQTLVIVGITSLFAASLHWRGGRVRPVVAMIFVLAGAMGAYVGAWAGQRVPGDVLLIALTLLMVVVSGLMLRSGSKQPTEADAAVEPPPARQGLVWLLLILPVVGLVVGFLTGFLGVGGGFLIVPALTLAARLPVKDAVGTSLIIIAANCGSGLLAHDASEVVPAVVVPFLMGSIGVSMFASRVAGRVRAASLKKGFAWFVLVVAVLIILDRLVLRG